MKFWIGMPAESWNVELSHKLIYLLDFSISFSTLGRLSSQMGMKKVLPSSETEGDTISFVKQRVFGSFNTDYS